MIQPRNLMIIVNDITGIHALLAQGYKILLCTEDPIPPDITMHPNIIQASILLPPYEAVSMELDHQIDSAQNRFWNYLSAYQPAYSMCCILYIAALHNQPLAFYFGSEYSDFHTIQSIPIYFQNFMGMTFSSAYGYGQIDTARAPYILNSMYMNCELNGMQVLSYFPQDMDLLPETVDKLMVELHPPVPAGDIKGGNEYFKQLIHQMNGNYINQYGQKLYCPFEGGQYIGGQK